MNFWHKERTLDFELDDILPKKVWPWAHHVSSQNQVSQMRMGVMSPALHVSQGWWDPIRGSMGTRKLSGKTNVPFRPVGIQLSDRTGSCSSIPHFRWLVLQPGSQEGGWITCSRAHSLTALEPAMWKKLWQVVMCQFQVGRQLCFLHKRLSWVRWVEGQGPQYSKTSSKCMKNLALFHLNDPLVIFWERLP